MRIRIFADHGNKAVFQGRPGRKEYPHLQGKEANHVRDELLKDGWKQVSGPEGSISQGDWADFEHQVEDE